MYGIIPCKSLQSSIYTVQDEIVRRRINKFILHRPSDQVGLRGSLNVAPGPRPLPGAVPTENAFKPILKPAFLHQALALLPDAQREAVILFEISGFNLKEVAEIQEASLSAVKQRLKRGRERL